MQPTIDRIRASIDEKTTIISSPALVENPGNKHLQILKNAGDPP